jgi:hypothetical protein
LFPTLLMHSLPLFVKLYLGIQSALGRGTQLSLSCLIRETLHQVFYRLEVG